MATSRKSGPAIHRQGEPEVEKRWWRTPTVIGSIIVAVIGGIFAISVAFIQRTAPKPNVSEPMTIEQRTYGPNSPAIGHTGGNVTIQQHGGGEKP
jgi:hypothetical protein